MGEHIYRRFKGTCVQGFTADCKDIKLVMCRDATFDIEQTQNRRRHLYLDLSRNGGAKGENAGRGAAMSAETSTCHNCGKRGHYARKCYRDRAGSIKKSSVAHGKHKNKKFFKGQGSIQGRCWAEVVFFVYKTNSHDDADS